MDERVTPENSSVKLPLSSRGIVPDVRALNRLSARTFCAIEHNVASIMQPTIAAATRCRPINRQTHQSTLLSNWADFEKILSYSMNLNQCWSAICCHFESKIKISTLKNPLWLAWMVFIISSSVEFNITQSPSGQLCPLLLDDILQTI